LSTLKYFSLICYAETRGYDNTVLPLLRRMPHLEELTLYIHIRNGSIFITGSHLDNEILIHMPQLRTFTFHIASETVINDSSIRVSTDDIHRLKKITNNIPDLIFHSVIHLKLWDKHPFKHEFFIRLARAFPSLQYLTMWNIQSPCWKFDKFQHLKNDWPSIVEYPHLISIDIRCAHTYYVEHFLNETKTRLPCLTELKVEYNDLQKVTMNFTRPETRRNCARVKRLLDEDLTVYSEDVYRYFPLLFV
jgi:hypothetical protein